MKHTLLIPALGLATAGMTAAQGLYNIMPFDDDPGESFPLHWTVGANIGYDSNPSPFYSDVSGYDSDGSLYVSAYVQGNVVLKDEQTTWDIWARLGIVYYFDEIEQTNSLGGTEGDADDFYVNPSAGVNFSHHVNERLRFRSRNNITYEQEPDYDAGIATDRRAGSYLSFSTDNSVGYRWTERFGTVTGYRLHGSTYDDVDNEDYLQHIFYNQFRYRTSPQTVLTSSYRYGISDNDSASDSTSHYLLVGAEHEFSPTTVGVIRVGGQYDDPDNGDTTWSPYLEATLKTQVNEQFGLRGFVYYGIVDRHSTVTVADVTGITPGGMPIFDSAPSVATFSERHLLRVGTQASYQVSPTLAIFGGTNLVHTSYEEALAVGVSDFDETLFNVNVGASYQVAENVHLTGSYNYSDSSSDSNTREYDRHRVQLGVQTSF